MAIPIPGLFHWRTNFMDMTYDVPLHVTVRIPLAR
jgi:hypothetical protein